MRITGTLAPAMALAAVFGLASAPDAPAQSAAAIAQETEWDRDERRRVQEALVWAGAYDGRIDGVFGQRTRAAIRDVQERAGNEVTGVLTPREARQLYAGQRDAERELGWSVRRFPSLGLSIGVPTELLGEAEETETGIVFPDARGGMRVALSLVSSEPVEDSDFAAIQSTLASDDPLTGEVYQRAGDGWFVRSGVSEEGRASYTYLRQTRRGIRGFRFVYPERRGEELSKLNVAFLNTLAILPRGDGRPTESQEMTLAEAVAAAKEAREAAPDEATPGEVHSGAAGVVISDDGTILTALSGIAGCEALAVGGQGGAEVLAENAEAGLALLSTERPASRGTVIATEIPARGEAQIAAFADQGPRAEPILGTADHRGVGGGAGGFSDLRLPPSDASMMPGSPVFDAEGALLAVVIDGPDAVRPAARNAYAIAAFLSAEGIARASEGADPAETSVSVRCAE